MWMSVWFSIDTHKINFSARQTVKSLNCAYIHAVEFVKHRWINEYWRVFKKLVDCRNLLLTRLIWSPLLSHTKNHLKHFLHRAWRKSALLSWVTHTIYVHIIGRFIQHAYWKKTFVTILLRYFKAKWKREVTTVAAADRKWEWRFKKEKKINSWIKSTRRQSNWYYN